MNAAEDRVVDADWAAIAVVVFGVTAFSVSQGLTYPLISLVLADRGVSTSVIGLNGAFFAIGVGNVTRTVELVDRRSFVSGFRAASVSFVI